MIEEKQVALVTGAYGAIGKAIAQGLAAKNDYEVVMAGRDDQLLKKALSDIQKKTGTKFVRSVTIDLSRKQSVQELSKNWKGPLHILVNNAATAPGKRTETPDGIEMQFATNVLGYFWMIEYFAPILEKSSPSRIVNVASYWSGDLELSDLQFKKRPYNNNTAYRQSKQANRMLTVAFAEKLKDAGIMVNACHPGDVNSKLSNSLGFGGHQAPDEGARTPLYLATTGSGIENTGKYFENCQNVKCRFAGDTESIHKLFQICEKFS